MENIHEFLYNHINTKRAQKCTPVILSSATYMDNQLFCHATYKMNFSYPSTRLAPSHIKVGLKEGRVCIRIDETERPERSKFIDYFADDLQQLKRLITHLTRLQRDYDRTTWFLRAQLIPSLFLGVINLFKKNQIDTCVALA